MNGPLTGFLVIDKAEGMTSHAVVQLIRRQIQIRKIGHLGTLDPMATGVLPLAVGRATRLARFLMGGRKVYEGTIQLGLTTDTYDRLGQPTSEFRQPRIAPDHLRTVVESMVGEQMQSPPPYSAKKIGGRRAYRLARQGLQVEIPPQRVRVHQFRFRQGSADTVDFEIHCSPGTYVRALAHELGQKLECGAHLSRLR
ncbi:MAG: tRNA pseudouridine(55) synthase TruB, partial [Acidobacteriota bacterium]|nr:tRNA pseudouridine(55) synthase TruB [Acidobacteriota bacterium]